MPILSNIKKLIPKKKWAFWLDNDMLSMWSMLQVIELSTAQKYFEFGFFLNVICVLTLWLIIIGWETKAPENQNLLNS